uniref:Amidohydro-rel domain-containing protein n=1 Tax=Syphacia muris TaxID=451379 RepID=A0A0N5AQJ0_9BILA
MEASQQVSPSLTVPAAATVIDATGKLLLPAGIDVHTHFSAPNSVDNFHIGSKAALAGGTATVIDAIVSRDDDSLLVAYDQARKAAESQSLCNYAFSVIIKNWNENVKKEMGLLVKEKGVNSFIIDLHNDDHLYQAFEHCKTLGVLARIFPENKNIVSLLEKKILAMGVSGPEGYLQARPEMLEAEYVDRASILSQLTNCPLSVVGVSSIETRNAVMRSRSNALLFPEIAIAALASDGTHYFNKCLQHASAHLTKSPLRLDLRTSSLLVDCFSSCPLCVCISDHCGIRDRGTGDFTHLSLGVSAAEERMSILWEKAVYSGRIDPMRFVAITSSNAAKMFNIYPKKGRIAVGADADLVIWDPNLKKKFSVKTQQSQSEFSIFEEQTVHSSPVTTICGGRIAFNVGKFDNEHGQFVPLLPQSPYMFSVVQQRDKVIEIDKVERDEQQLQQNGISRSRESLNNPRTPVARNQFESSFSASGSHFDDNRSVRASTKIINPPGGRSTGFW